MSTTVEQGFWTRLSRRLLGDPLRTAEAPHQTVGKGVGLAIFASDALSSTAYATEEILFVLMLAGTGALSLSLPIALAIVVLLAIVTLSYNQTIEAYPGGGGAYVVARDNLGTMPAQIAGASLLTDYILTVAVSISAGVAQMTSAFPELMPHRVLIAVSLIAGMTLMNLRGLKESGSAFAIPTYFFVAMTTLTLGFGFYQYATGQLAHVTGIAAHAAEAAPLSLFLLLRAFSSGCAALTGVEAISNGVTVFREPRSRNARITMIWMCVILAVLFLGITFLANAIGAIPLHTETVISQLARTLYGGNGVGYLVMMGATTLILVMAANTGFADFPRLAALQAQDNFLPKQLTFLGTRLVFSNGILALAAAAALLVVVFDAQTNALIPLYAIGVFLSFTLSQSGMAVRWWRAGLASPGQVLADGMPDYDPKWRGKLIINGIGAVCTALVMMVFAVTKFAQGAWIVAIVLPALVAIFFRIHRHYEKTEQELTLEVPHSEPAAFCHTAVVLVSRLDRGILRAISYAKSIDPTARAVHIAVDEQKGERLSREWISRGLGIDLIVLPSPHRYLIDPITHYLEVVEAERDNDVITIIIPELVEARWWQYLLHNQDGIWLRFALGLRRGIVVTNIPYHLEE